MEIFEENPEFLKENKLDNVLSGTYICVSQTQIKNMTKSS